MSTEQATVDNQAVPYVFDFEKMAAWLRECGYREDFIDDYRDIYTISKHGRLVSDSGDLFKLIPACLRFECHKMWARFDDPQSDGKWCDDRFNFIHFGVSDDFASGKPVMFYYKVNHDDEDNPFSAPSAKYHIFSESLMVDISSTFDYQYGFVKEPTRPMKPDPLAVRRRVSDWLLCKVVFALEDPDCEEIAIHGEERRGERRPIPRFYRVY